MLLVAFCSCGNDSVALIQRLHELGHEGVKVVYSDTGWAAPDWAARVEKVRAWVNGLGFEFITTKTMGFPDLARHKSGFPMPKAGFQFCTLFLKIVPALQLLDEIDEINEAVCCIGVRREESANRSQHPIWIHDSEKHGGRMLWAPLAEVTERERDALIVRAGFDPLPHRSMECSPCIYANREDLRMVPEERAAEIEGLEKELGVTANGKPRFMFRPRNYMGARGIREVMRWAWSERGKFAPGPGPDWAPPAPPMKKRRRKEVAIEEPIGGCDSGFCGS